MENALQGVKYLLKELEKPSSKHLKLSQFNKFRNTRKRYHKDQLNKDCTSNSGNRQPLDGKT